MKPKKTKESQVFILQRCFLYSLTDHILAKKNEIKSTIQKEKGNYTDEKMLILDIKLSIWQGFYGYIAQKTLTNQLPPYVFRGCYERLINQLEKESEEVIESRLNQLIEDILNYVATHKQKSSKIDQTSKEWRGYREVEQQVWDTLWSHLVSVIKGLKALDNPKHRKAPMLKKILT